MFSLRWFDEAAEDRKLGNSLGILAFSYQGEKAFSYQGEGVHLLLEILHRAPHLPKLTLPRQSVSSGYETYLVSVYWQTDQRGVIPSEKTEKN